MLSVIYDILISFIYLLKIIFPALLGRMSVWEFRLPKDILQECLEGGGHSEFWHESPCWVSSLQSPPPPPSPHPHYYGEGREERYLHLPLKKLGWAGRYYFPTAVMANHHKLSGLNNINVLSYGSEGQRFHWAKIKVVLGLRSFWGLQAKISSPDFFCFCKLPAFLGSGSVPQSSNLLLTLTLLPPSCKDSCIGTI